MGNISDYEKHSGEIEAVKEEDIKICAIPIEIEVQEAEDLYHWAMEDLAMLQTVGFQSATLERMHSLCGAIREAQSRWSRDKKMKKDAIAEWNEVVEEAYGFRDNLVKICDYAYRKNYELMSAVRYIKQGRGDADMIQDLNDLAVLGRNNLEPIVAINQDPELFTKAAIQSDYLADLRARANGDIAEENESKVLRDKAYTLLKAEIDEVRDCGKFVFRDDESRLKGYRSAYLRKKNLKAKNKSEEDDNGED